MKDKLKKIMERDQNKCGIHLGGCGKEFQPDDDITIDHMISKSFLKGRKPNKIFYNFYKPCFLQPMHKSCNSEEKRGQINNYPIFNCNCHYLYFNVNENKSEVFYKIRSQWESQIFHDKILGEQGSFTLIAGQKGGKRGYYKDQFGHILPSISFSERNKYHIQNFHSLLKCKRLGKAWAEAKLIDFKDYDKQGKSKIYLTLGDICVDNNEYNKSMVYFDRAIDISPKFFEAYNSRGVLKGKLRQYKEAIEDFNKVITLNPNYANAYNNIGRVKNNLGRYEEAIEYCTNAIKIDAQHANAYYNRCVANATLKNNKEAITDYSKAKILFEKEGNIEMVEKCESSIARLNELMSDE